MSSLDKMWASFVAIGLMVVASLLISYARTRTKGVLRVVLSVIAFFLFIPILLYMLLSLF
ncbi:MULTISPECIES: DUF2768 family protein [unclassified Paenibacillus]|jgi:hypothetical protein|uniref:DUF2768 family protein n=1 Tax=unclassified Paenibacillus TaxID=185978 RepID=UPI002785E129|nr:MULTISPECIES: DUF2768 family protein [unclassified Paenibacillus]MDF2649983.1 hypothetical protein [Paenibacillus sp.]MDQ0898311.1 hypothetical protein [Paenibacillus sp. V4I7]MDQ0915677.1 hypothetical protein [Paenibacillus sp. V4I5]